MKKRTIGLLICLLLMTMAAAWPTSVRAEGLPAVQSSAETVRTIELAQGTNARIIAELNGQIRLNPAFAAGEAISYWKSSNIKTVSVDETGLLTANREGAVTVSVKTVSGVRAKVEVKVVDPYKPEKIAFTQSGTLILNKDETLQLSAVMEPATARSELTYSTSNKRYATVDGQGVVTGHAEGTAKITVRTYNGRKATIKIKVVDPYKPEKIAFTQSGTLILNKDETLQLNAVMEPATARSELTYSTSNKRYATVDAQGVVTGHAEGTAKITVRTYNGRKATIKIKVVDPYKPEKIAFTQVGTLILNKDETLQLSAVMEPATARSELTYSTSNKRYATVDAQGVVTGHAEGTVKITVRTYNGRKATIKIKVVDPYKPEKIAFTQSGTLILNKDETLQLSAVMEPATARSELTYSTSNKRYATVDGQGVVTGHAEGTAKITVRTYNGRKATIKIKVVDPYKPEKIAFTQTGTLILARGETLALNAVMEPTTARSELTWSSSAAKYAAVNETGVVTGLREGSARITVRTYNGKKATIKIKVVDPYKPENISFAEGKTLTINQNEWVNLKPVMEPATAQSELTWSSSDPEYASVNPFGLVYGHRLGNATITVRTHNGKKARIQVRVIDPYAPDKVSIDGPETIVIERGLTLKLSASVEPATAIPRLNWFTSNKNYVRIDGVDVDDLTFVAVSEGTATITVKSQNGLTDQVKIKVISPPALKGDIRECFGMDIGEVNRRIDKQLQKVDDTLYYNTYLMMFTDPFGNVRVAGMSADINKVSTRYNLFGVRLGISRKQADASLIENGWIPFLEAENERLYLTPENPDAIMDIVWDASGNIISVLYGDIYAAGLGNQPTDIRISPGTVVLEPGQQLQLTPTLYPETSYTKLTWMSHDPEVVTVDEYGYITAVKPGMTGVRAVAGNGVWEICSVCVSSPTHYFGDLTGFMGKQIDEAVAQMAIKPTQMDNERDLYHCFNYDVYFRLDASRMIIGIKISAYDNRYTLGGVYHGIPKSEAVSLLNQAGWNPTGGAPVRDLFAEDLGIVEELVFTSARYPGRMHVRCDEYGSVISIIYDGR